MDYDDDGYRGLTRDPLLQLMDEDDFIAYTAKALGITPDPWCTLCDKPRDEHDCPHAGSPA